jgi:glycosyltransferase involved in cell wall biosynthesis
MKVLQLNDRHEEKGGVEIFLRFLTQELENAGVTTTRMTVTRAEGRHLDVRASGEPQPMLATFDAWRAKFSALLDRDDIDLIHIHSMSDPRVIDVCLNLRPTIRSMHDPHMFCPGGGKFWRRDDRICTIPFGHHCLLRAYTQGCCNRNPSRLIEGFRNTRYEAYTAARRYRRILVMSQYMKDEALRVGYAPEKIIVLPCFTRRQSEPVPPDRAPRRLLFIGRFIQHKGLHKMLEALRYVFAAHDDVVLDLVGDGMHYPLMTDAVARLGTDGFRGRVLFHGWKTPDETASFYVRASVTLFPSIYAEAFGIVGIESMMHGRPVVAFDVGGSTSWLETGVTGLVVPAGDTRAFAQAVSTLLSDDGLYHEMSVAARKAALSRFTADSHIPRLIHAYREVLAEN